MRRTLRETRVMQRVSTFFAEAQLRLGDLMHGFITDGTVVFFLRHSSSFRWHGGGSSIDFACRARVRFLNAPVGDGVRSGGCVVEDFLEFWGEESFLVPQVGGIGNLEDFRHDEENVFAVVAFAVVGACVQFVNTTRGASQEPPTVA
jgi:hypothetical protein